MLVLTVNLQMYGEYRNHMCCDTSSFVLSLVSVTCNAPPTIQHSTLVLTKSNSIFTTTYTCDGGYKLANPASSTKECTAGATSWSTPDVACELKGNMSVCSIVNTIIPSRFDQSDALLHNIC